MSVVIALLAGALLSFIFFRNRVLFFVVINSAAFILVGLFCGFLLGFSLDNFANAESTPVLLRDGGLAYSGSSWAVLWKELPYSITGILPLFLGAMAGLVAGFSFGRKHF